MTTKGFVPPEDISSDHGNAAGCTAERFVQRHGDDGELPARCRRCGPFVYGDEGDLPETFTYDAVASGSGASFYWDEDKKYE
ncbi:hypothetical protein C484_10246 [Natrialba taiwanensis DSM 12281]|uniref:Uncharacterized protein n=1 Tax=Natrialba taiwanensis DSM 12281 TaxID=1230458 RepID=M0A0L5_9EURY|nr:hypothetical protein C484_10246 [Natrialba taiwanensis DSM 12281]